MNCGDSIRVVHPLFQEEDDGSIPISPLQLEIHEISVDTAVLLNNICHSRLPEITNPHGGICFAGTYKNKYYFSAIWTQPVAANRLKDGFRKMELRRMAIFNDAPKNTASRALKIMKNIIKNKFPHVISLISYQDTNVHNGTIYKAAGWHIANIQDKFQEWTTKTRKRNIAQAPSAKIRWEYDLYSQTILPKKSQICDIAPVTRPGLFLI